MKSENIVSKKEWLLARAKLLTLEKAHSKARIELTTARQSLPWVKVEKDYVFQGEDSERSLDDLFGSKSQLIVHHFMFREDWQAGCKSCSLLADSYALILPHIKQRDTAFVTVSRAHPKKLSGFKKRMGWTFDWLSSLESDFNFDFHVSFTEEEFQNHTLTYNYQENTHFPEKEAPGLSVFVKEGDEIFHTYSAYARGLEDFLTTYNFLDITPKGRDETSLPHTMDWVRLRDEYDNSNH